MAEGVSHEKRFVAPPGYTQIPNILLDEVLPVAGHAEWKVTCAIARQTFGWGKDWRRFTNQQLCKLTGLARQSVTDGLEQAEKRGFIGRRSLGGNHYEFGLRVKKGDAEGDSETGEHPSNQAESILATRRRTSKGNKTLRGKEKPLAASPLGAAKKGDTKKKPGMRFVPDPADPADAVIIEVYELWLSNTTQPDGTVLTNNRAGQVRARLREQAEGVERETALTTARERLIEGLEGWFGSDWHKANQAFDWETFFRSRKKVEMFRGRHRQARANGNGGKPDFSAYRAQVENA